MSSETNTPLHLLVIDDDEVVCQLLEMMLAMDGHAVVTAMTGREGLARLAEGGTVFDAVLCDQQLPDLGTEALGEQLQAASPAQTLRIAISATVPAEETAARYDAFLQKPFQPEDLFRVLEQALAARNEGKASSPTAVATPAKMEAAPVLDERIFRTMAVTLSAPKLLELYTMTLDDVGQRLERMYAALAGGDRELFRREAHAIKGGCGMVGAVELRELAAVAEGGAPESTPPETDFVQACERLRRMLIERLT